MEFHILTLFSDPIDVYLKTSILKKSLEKKCFSFNIINIRDFSSNKHRKVDDTVYGGGPGMLISCQVLDEAIKSVYDKDSVLIFLSPSGRQLNQSFVRDLSHEKKIILVCGFYEGFDYRIFDLYPKHILLSLGPFILTNGILAALCVIDSLVRIQEDSLSNRLSASNESFENSLLEEPQYTRPSSYKGLDVPEILKSGHHAQINQWKKNMQLLQTIQKQPEMLERVPLSLEDLNFLITYYTDK